MSKLLLALLGSLSVFLASCASSGGSGSGSGSGADGDRLRVLLRDYKGGHRFELVSESHTNRLDYYSEARDDASRKVQADKVMDALLGELRKRGFKKHQQEGRAPSAGGALISWGLEVESGERTDHWVVGKGSAFEELQDFQECRSTFLELYNITASYQAIENPGGKVIFEKPQSGRT